MSTAEFLEKNWWVLVLRGVIAALFGIYALINPGAALSLLVLIFGIFLVIDGILSVVGAIVVGREGGSWGVFLLIGVLEIAVAILAFTNPDVFASLFFILIGIWALFKGLFELLLGIAISKEVEGEWMLILSGVLSMLFGVLAILFPFFESAAAGAVILLGLYALLYGVLMIIIGFGAKSLAKAVRKADAAGELPVE